jgi:hypothetical protein
MRTVNPLSVPPTDHLAACAGSAVWGRGRGSVESSLPLAQLILTPLEGRNWDFELQVCNFDLSH